MGVVFEFGDEIVGADVDGFGVASARYDETARDERVAGGPNDVVLFPSDIGLVDLYGPLSDFAVNDYLVAEAIDEEVTFDDVGLVDLEGFAVSNDGGLLLGDEFELVDSAFGADFVDDADESVSDGDEEKKEIFVGANRDNHEGKDEIDEVENREGVF